MWRARASSRRRWSRRRTQELLEEAEDDAAIRRVLLVDDEATLRRLGTRMLQAQNVVCEVLEDGCDVAAMLTPAHELLLLDIEMRQSDGVEARAAAHLNGLPARAALIHASVHECFDLKWVELAVLVW